MEWVKKNVCPTKTGRVHSHSKVWKFGAGGFPALFCGSYWAGRPVMSFPIPVRSNWVLLALKNQSVRLPLCESQVFFLSAPVWVQGYCLHSKIWYQLRYVETRDKCKGIGKIIIKCVTRKTLTVPNSSRKLGMHFTLAIKIYLSYVELLCIFFPQITFMWHFGLLVFYNSSLKMWMCPHSYVFILTSKT